MNDDASAPLSGAISPDELSERTRSGASSAAPRTPGVHRQLRVLITNDDGIDSPGLHRLARLALDAGMSVVVAAPLSDSSGASASITASEAGGRFIVEERSMPDLPGAQVFGVGALPAFIALTAIRGAFGDPPDLVLSGINTGPNTGHAILHSGTVGAALTAAAHQTSALAVSLGVGPTWRWDSAAAIAQRVLPALFGAPRGTVLNLNVPNVAAEEIRGLRQAPLATFGAVQTNIEEVGKGYFQISVAEVDVSSEPDSDAALLAAGWATLTALRPVCEAVEIDLEALVDTQDPVAMR